jgi:hypothetical protein
VNGAVGGGAEAGFSAQAEITRTRASGISEWRTLFIEASRDYEYFAAKRSASPPIAALNRPLQNQASLQNPT